MEDYIIRMQLERDELCKRVDRLNKAIAKFEMTSPKRYALMENQLKSMKEYLFYLEERIHYEISLSKTDITEDI